MTDRLLAGGMLLCSAVAGLAVVVLVVLALAGVDLTHR